MARELHAAEVKMAKQQVAARHVLENIMDKQDEENEVLTKHLEQGRLSSDPHVCVCVCMCVCVCV